MASGCELNSAGSRSGPVAGSCEHGNEIFSRNSVLSGVSYCMDVAILFHSSEKLHNFHKNVITNLYVSNNFMNS